MRATASVWIGRVISGLVVVFLLLDSVTKLIPIQPVIDTMQVLGFHSTPDLARGLGCVLLMGTVLYVIPRTCIVGAILLTGYLGGAIATQLRVEAPVLTHLFFGAYVGIAMWLGLFLRDASTRTILKR
jgi:DoxX-like family